MPRYEMRLTCRTNSDMLQSEETRFDAMSDMLAISRLSEAVRVWRRQHVEEGGGIPATAFSLDRLNEANKYQKKIASGEF